MGKVHSNRGPSHQAHYTWFNLGTPGIQFSALDVNGAEAVPQNVKGIPSSKEKAAGVIPSAKEEEHTCLIVSDTIKPYTKNKPIDSEISEEDGRGESLFYPWGYARYWESDQGAVYVKHIEGRDWIFVDGVKVNVPFSPTECVERASICSESKAPIRLFVVMRGLKVTQLKENTYRLEKLPEVSGLIVDPVKKTRTPVWYVDEYKIGTAITGLSYERLWYSDQIDISYDGKTALWFVNVWSDTFKTAAIGSYVTTSIAVTLDGTVTTAPITVPGVQALTESIVSDTGSWNRQWVDYYYSSILIGPDGQVVFGPDGQVVWIALPVHEIPDDLTSPIAQIGRDTYIREKLTEYSSPTVMQDVIFHVGRVFGEDKEQTVKARHVTSKSGFYSQYLFTCDIVGYLSSPYHHLIVRDLYYLTENTYYSLPLWEGTAINGYGVVRTTTEVQEENERGDYAYYPHPPGFHDVESHTLEKVEQEGIRVSLLFVDMYARVALVLYTEYTRTKSDETTRTFTSADPNHVSSSRVLTDKYTADYTLTLYVNDRAILLNKWSDSGQGDVPVPPYESLVVRTVVVGPDFAYDFKKRPDAWPLAAHVNCLRRGDAVFVAVPILSTTGQNDFHATGFWVVAVDTQGDILSMEKLSVLPGAFMWVQNVRPI